MNIQNVKRLITSLYDMFSPLDQVEQLLIGLAPSELGEAEQATIVDIDAKTINLRHAIKDFRGDLIRRRDDWEEKTQNMEV